MITHLEAWQTDEDAFPKGGAPGEVWEFLLRYAILAPSSHNSQPWLFRIRGDTLELYADRTRHLPITDPQGRQLIISCGCAAYHLRIALEHFGCLGTVAILPDADDPDLLARFTLGEHGSPTVEDNLLFLAIRKRRTNRQAFEDRPLPESLLSALQVAAKREGAWLDVIRDAEQRHAIADLIAEGDRRQWAQKSFRLELAAWVHGNRAGARDGIPGYAQGIEDLLSYAGPLVVRTFDMGGGQAAKNHELATHSPALVVLGTGKANPPEWMRAGQALARVLLRARMEDVWASFLNQPIEVHPLKPALRRLLGHGGEPQLILRLGYGPEIRPTPRRHVRDVLI
jgi:nitroreductase